MAVNIDKAIATAREVIQRAHKEGKLRQLTNRIVRAKVEQLLNLEEGTLAEKEYKKRINEAVASTVESLQNEDDKKGMEETGSKAKAEVLNKEAVPSEGSGSSGNKTKPVSTKSEKKKMPKSKSPDKSSGSAEDSQKEGKTKGNYKSKETIELDDEDMDYTADIPAAKPVVEGVPPSTKGKRRVDSNDENDDLEDATPSKRRKKAGETTPKPKKPRVSTSVKKKKNSEPAPEAKKPDNTSPTLPSNIEDAEAKEGEKSDSELSVLPDGPPTKRGGSSSKSKDKSEGATKEKSRGKKATKELSADEEQIKKLKSLVVGCGVRKIWSKEFKDCETPSSQIAHLRRMLSDLGMKGRFSMEQAKAIKEKRELAKEMDDVQEFAQKFVGGRSRHSSTTKGKDQAADMQEGEGDEEEDEEDTQGVSRRPRNAHRSIMAFLGDQSDSD